MLPKVKKRIAFFLDDERGSVSSFSLVNNGIILAGIAFSAFSLAMNSSPGLAQVHTSHGTHANTTTTHNSHISHATHSSHSNHSVHATHCNNVPDIIIS
jgi:hypothetical protein